MVKVMFRDSNDDSVQILECHHIYTMSDNDTDLMMYTPNGFCDSVRITSNDKSHRDKLLNSFFQSSIINLTNDCNAIVRCEYSEDVETPSSDVDIFELLDNMAISGTDTSITCDALEIYND